MRSVRTGRGRFGTTLVLSAASIVSLLPMVLVLVGSFRPNSDIVSEPTGLPAELFLENYVNAWTEASLALYFFNSVIATVGALVLTVALFLPVSYALGRWRFRGARVILGVFLMGLMVSLRIGILPIAQMFDSLGLLDTLFGLVLVYAAQAAPMTVLILSTFYRELPATLEDAALLDGASHWRIFVSVMTPLVRPALAAALVLDVGPIWNDFFMPLVLLRTPENSTLPLGITHFFSEFSSDRGLLYAGIMIAVLPVIVFFALAMKQIVSGLTAGMEK